MLHDIRNRREYSLRISRVYLLVLSARCEKARRYILQRSITVTAFGTFSEVYNLQRHVEGSNG
jgi:hypothetical protein